MQRSGTGEWRGVVTLATCDASAVAFRPRAAIAARRPPFWDLRLLAVKRRYDPKTSSTSTSTSRRDDRAVMTSPRLVESAGKWADLT
jgi:hypothetical protein